MDKALLVLKARPWKWLLILVVCAAFAWVGWWMTGAEAGADRAKGWFVLVFFGLCAVVAIIATLAPSQVVLTADGLHIRTLFRHSFIRWDHVERFGVHEWMQWSGPFRQKHRQVGLVFRDEHRRNTGRLDALVRAWSDLDGALPDNYGYEHHELADLLNRYLDNHRDRKDRSPFPSVPCARS